MSKKEIQEVVTPKFISPDEKLVLISADIKKIKKRVGIIKITDEKTYASANKLVIDIKNRVNRLDELKDETVKPIKDFVKVVEAKLKEPRDKYSSMELTVKRSMSDFQIEEESKVREKEAKLRAKREKEIEKAEAKGKPAPVTPVPIVERKEATVKTDEGKSTAKKIIKFQIEDAEKLPKKYRDQIFAKAVEKGIADQIMRPQMKLGLEISRDEKSGEVVTKLKGVKVWEDFDISVTA